MMWGKSHSTETGIETVQYLQDGMLQNDIPDTTQYVSYPFGLPTQPGRPTHSTKSDVTINPASKGLKR